MFYKFALEFAVSDLSEDKEMFFQRPCFCSSGRLFWIQGEATE